MKLVSEQNLYYWNTEVKVIGGNNMMKSNPNQVEQVKHEGEFRVPSLQPAPIPLLLFLSMA